MGGRGAFRLSRNRGGIESIISRAKSSESRDLEWGRTLPELTVAQIKNLLAFRGYGNPSGRFWFIGMEEGGKSDFEHLRIRADKFPQLGDLAETHSHFPTHNMSKLTTSTWGLMSSIVGRINGEQNWWDTEFRRAYQATKLGRLGGETYLTEMLPLPKKGIAEWPYGNMFRSPEDYFDKRFPHQLAALRREYDSAFPKPQFVFCYGKAYWHRHQEVFDFIDFQSALDGAIKWGRNEHTFFALTKFLDFGRMGFTEEFVDRLCEFALSESPNQP